MLPYYFFTVEGNIYFEGSRRSFETKPIISFIWQNVIIKSKSGKAIDIKRITVSNITLMLQKYIESKLQVKIATDRPTMLNCLGKYFSIAAYTTLLCY